MTRQELYDDVAAMGFDRGFADDGIFYTAANRAIETLNARFPMKATVTLLHRPPRVLAYRQTLPAGGDMQCGGVRAYTFAVSGGSVAEIYADGVPIARHRAAASHTPQRVYGTLPAACDCRIAVTDGTLHGSFLLADCLPNGGEGVTLSEKETCYSLTALHASALSMASPPERADGRALSEGRDYRMASETVLALKNARPDTYTLHLHVAGKRLTPDSASPDVRADAMHLLPTLTAAYAWLDLDREKAVFYLNLYREAAAYRETSPASTASVGYGDVNHW